MNAGHTGQRSFSNWTIVSLVIGALVSVTAAFPQAVHIADPNLELTVREILGKQDGELSRADMERLVFMEAPRRGITTLDGFVGATNLEELDLSFNELTGVTLPADLTKLSFLNVRGNPLAYLAADGRLPAMEWLIASECTLADVRFVGQMQNLVTLEIQANDLASFEPPIELSSLRSLDLGFNRVRDLSFLGRLPNLASLILDDNGFTDFALPMPMPKLTLLSLTVNRIRDLSFLKDVPNLQFLDLASNFATNYTFPEGLRRLQWINLGENRLSTISFPDDMTNLWAVYLDDNRFTIMPSVGPLRELRSLDVGINQLMVVTIPHTLTNLSRLDVSFNPLNTIIVPDVIATNRANRIFYLLDDLRQQGVTVHVYPVVPRLSNPVSGSGGFRFLLRGPPGAHEISRSENLRSWSTAGYLTNMIGVVEGSVSTELPELFLRTELR